MSQPSGNTTSSGITKGKTIFFAIAGGVAVGNLYWAQPLLAVIAEALDRSVGHAGLLITVTQIGYAIGMLLLVPLGDVWDRRRLLSTIMVLASLALLCASLAPQFGMLLLALACVGLMTVGGQLLPPLVSDLAAPEQRGRAVGTVVSGILSGILLSRAISGVLADLLGWRAVFGVAALVTLIMALLLWRNVPSDAERMHLSYARLLGSIGVAIREHAVVRVTLLLGPLVFSVFTLFWTGLTFLLSEPPFSYSLSQIGLIGIAGLAGAVAARSAGKLHDRGLSVRGTGIALLMTLVSLTIATVGANSIVLIITAIVLLDAAIQTVNVLNQTRLMSVDAAARSRLNSAFVTANFIGGAIGSALASVIWSWGGWYGLMTAAACLVVMAFLIWHVNRDVLAHS